MAVSVPIVAAVAGAVVSTALAPKPAKAADPAAAIAAPTVDAPKIMPLADDASVKSAQKKSIAEQIAAQGRASTILSQGTADTLG